ncbi:MAG: DNA-protecting protein DprA [candidate division WS1 bacterium]|jgi:DNA processing protein|nr:DNA-protecting protein DprA [candidate division WS1 bacterium]
MDNERTQRLAQIALVWYGGLGPIGYRRVVGHFGGAQEALRATPEELSVPSLRLDPERVNGVSQAHRHLEDVAAETKELAQQNIRVLCDVDEAYPCLLKRMRDRPPVLCVAGRLDEEAEPSVAIVGTRSPTREGKEQARLLARACVAERLTVVSGLALGCDTWAHRGALEVEGRTVAVLGSGIRLLTPKENAELGRRIAETGAVVSELPPWVGPSSSRLLARNRLQVALSQVVIVVQAGPSGGAMSTAERAFRTGRPVCVVTWPVDLEKTEGNEKLLQAGGHPLTGPEEIPELARMVRENLERVLREEPGEGSQKTLFADQDQTEE